MINNINLPVLTYDHVNLDVHLDPEDGLKMFTKFGFSLKIDFIMFNVNMDCKYKYD